MQQDELKQTFLGSSNLDRMPVNDQMKSREGDKQFEQGLAGTKKQDDGAIGRMPTFGEELIGTSFNPSCRPDVDDVKATCARMVDLIHRASSSKSRSPIEEIVRRDAVQQVMHACMSMVKYLTLSDK